MISNISADNQKSASESTVPQVSGGGQSFSEILDKEVGSDDGIGYTYTDKYGFCHVVADQPTAREYSRDATGPTEQWTSLGGEDYTIFSNPGKIMRYTGEFAGGYALNDTGGRVSLPLPGCVVYGNSVKAAAVETDGDTSSPTRVQQVIDTMLSDSLVYMKYILPLEVEKQPDREKE